MNCNVFCFKMERGKDNENYRFVKLKILFYVLFYQIPGLISTARPWKNPSVSAADWEYNAKRDIASWILCSAPHQHLVRWRLQTDKSVNHRYDKLSMFYTCSSYFPQKYGILSTSNINPIVPFVFKKQAFTSIELLQKAKTIPITFNIIHIIPIYLFSLSIY